MPPFGYKYTYIDTYTDTDTDTDRERDTYIMTYFYRDIVWRMYDKSLHELS